MLVSVHSLVVNTLGWQVEGCWFVSQKLSFVRRCIGGKNSQIKHIELPAIGEYTVMNRIFEGL